VARGTLDKNDNSSVHATKTSRGSESASQRNPQNHGVSETSGTSLATGSMPTKETPMPNPAIHHDLEMLQAHPHGVAFDRASLIACLQACLDCAQTCVSCADACSAEEDPRMLARCIRLNNDCADLCATTARIVSRQTEPDSGLIRAVIDACATACAACASECEKHGKHMEHCRICAEACRACENACRRMMAAKASA
jgi:hypothetical protein